MMYLNQTFKQAVLKNDQENTKAGVILVLIPSQKNKQIQQTKNPQEINGSLVITLLSKGKGFYNFL